MKRRSGFTLIELLVVIAIIAILAAILFPVFANAKESANQTKCAGNVGQLAKGLVMYADDYNGTLPGLNLYTIATGTGGSTGDTNSDLAKGVLFRYVGRSRGVIACPTDSRWKDPVYAGKSWYSYPVNSYCTWVGRNSGGSYVGFSSASFTEMRAKSNTAGAMMSWYNRPTKTIYLVEENTNSTDPRSGQQVINDALFYDKDRTSNRHRGYANVSYLDGHVGHLKGWLQQRYSKDASGVNIFTLHSEP